MVAKQTRLLNMMATLAAERTILGFREKEYVILGRKLGLTWREMANALDVPITTLRDRYYYEPRSNRRNFRRKPPSRIRTQ